MTKEYSRNLTADETVALRSVRKSGSVHAGVALGLTLAGMTVGLYQQSAHAEEETGSKDSTFSVGPRLYTPASLSLEVPGVLSLCST